MICFGIRMIWAEVFKVLSATQRAELDLIAAFQGDGGFHRIMTWFSWLGAEALKYLLPFTYFVVSRTAGTRVFLLYSISSSLLEPLKVAFHLPRPYWIDARIKGLSTAGNYGMPSGHVLGASVVWPLIAQAIGKRWAYLVALTAVLLVSVSRVYLGVHFISDVIGAWVVAAGLIGGLGWLERRFSNWAGSLSVWWQVGIAVWATSALLAAAAGTHALTAKVIDPPAWSIFSGNGRSLKGVFEASGEFLGVACGAIMAHRWARFEVHGPLWRGGVALSYTLAGGWLLREFFKAVPTPHNMYLQFSFEFFRGAASMGWILFVAPWILLKANILHAPDLKEHVHSVHTRA